MTTKYVVFLPGRVVESDTWSGIGIHEEECYIYDRTEPREHAWCRKIPSTYKWAYIEEERVPTEYRTKLLLLQA